MKCHWVLRSRRKTVLTFVCDLDHEHGKQKGIHPKGMYFIDINAFWGKTQPGVPMSAHDTTNRLHLHPSRPHYGDYPKRRA